MNLHYENGTMKAIYVGRTKRSFYHFQHAGGQMEFDLWNDDRNILLSNLDLLQ